MGQKVHPLGFRVGITKNHQSQWFARFHKQKYAQSVLEDRMIRETLSKLFPELLNPILNSPIGKKRNQEPSLMPRITQIKIERGLIPYEIGIQIHAENCDLLKSAIDNLKVKRELIEKLQKTRRYLLNLKDKLKDLNGSSSKTLDLKSKKGSKSKAGLDKKSTSLLKKGKSKISKIRTVFRKKIKTKSKLKTKPGRAGMKKPFKFRVRLSKQELRHKRIVERRLKKRRLIRRRYRLLFSKGLFIKKRGTKVIKRLILKRKKLKFFALRFGKRLNKTQLLIKQARTAARLPKLKKRKGQSLALSFAKEREARKRKANSAPQIKGQSKKIKSLRNPMLSSRTKTFNKRIRKKFLTVFIEKMNDKFLTYLKSILTQMASNPPIDSSSLGYVTKWSLSRLTKLKKKPLYKLNRLVNFLERKLLIKFESLRKEFITLGSFSTKNVGMMGYFQILTFLKGLKELVSKLKRDQKLLALRRQHPSAKYRISTSLLSKAAAKLKLTERNKQKSLPNKVVNRKLNNIDKECRQLKFIEYLKDLVKTHRTENIYFYLSTMADARKDLRKLREFTKLHANFLFGINLETTKSLTGEVLKDQLTGRINQVLEKVAKKQDYEKSFSEVFLDQVERQKAMCLDNLQLVPKISIKFYSVNQKTLDQKASVVAYSVVDALEKRKSFRKVIKDAKEVLMKTPGVKGVKIQVAGRLNGAEIARTEWVRAGRVPLQTLRAKLDYSNRTASTIYGIIGVKVWIFKGYTKLITQKHK
jgi:ribosomal protein S3